VRAMARAASRAGGEAFVPDLHRIEKWWDSASLGALGRAAAVLRAERAAAGRRSADLAALAFCRALIESANVSFGHQSMSFRQRTPDAGDSRHSRRGIEKALVGAVESIAGAAAVPLGRGRRRVHLGDSRDVQSVTGDRRFDQVVTSPPYANRMSYIRELRPYMYWLGHLVERRDAGELDWRAIGGTWGAATSRLATWKSERPVPFVGFDRIARRISEREPLLGNYVRRYFEDMARHVTGLRPVMIPGGRLRYVIGNSKFFDVLVPAEEILVSELEAAGFTRCRITALRKRTSKRELFEYLVEATA